MQGRRLLVGCVLVAAVSGLFVHYGVTAESRDSYPGNEAVALSYDDHVGEVVQISAIVRPPAANGSDSGSDANATRGTEGTMTVVLRGWESFGPLTVRDADRTAAPGGTVQVAGTLEAGRTVTAERVLPVNPHPWSEPYKYAVSVVGAALILAVFFREWRVDTGGLAFEVREDG